ncbi:MAG: Fic family protein [Desulfuromonadales bacterium]|nr:Fic family protein [Desulfuromonadales bacterium]
MLSKGGFTFAAPAYIPTLMTDFEKAVLARYTPCNFTNASEIALAMAVVHVELVLIHPFREGNGRLARLLAILMALQAGLPVLEFGLLDVERERYFAAVRVGMDRDYEPMRKLFAEIIEMSVSKP